MTLSLVATAEPSHSPPRVLLTATESDPAFVISTCTLFRDGVALRFTPTISGQVALAYDYDAEFDVALAYRADAVESGIVQAWAEAWASTAAWTAGTSGAGWSVAAGIASALADGSSIYRDLGGPLASLAVTSPTNVTVQLLDSGGLVIGSVRVAPDGNVTVVAGSASTVVGSGTFTLTVSGSSLTVAGTGWSTAVDLVGEATRIRLVAPSSPSLVSSFGGSTHAPSGIAIDASGNIWTTGYNADKVQKFSSAGVLLLEFGGTGTANGLFNAPTGIALDGSGSVFVVDRGNSRVQKFNATTGAYVSKFGTLGSGNGQFSQPQCIAIDGSGNMWVTDQFNSRVQKFDSSGAYVSKFGTSGTGNGQFSNVYGIALDASGNIYVVDDNNLAPRVQKFSSAHAYVSKFGTLGSGNGQFRRPFGIKVDASGNIWVTDTQAFRVQKFDSAFAYKTQVGPSALLGGPEGVSLDASGNIWVTDADTGTVQKWTPAGPTVDDITASIANDSITVSASDSSASLTGITAAWLTNAAQPDLALAIDDCEDPDSVFYMTEETRRQRVSRSTSVSLEIEGSAYDTNVVTGPRKKATWSLDIACRTEEARRALEAVLANSAAVNLRLPADLAYLGLDDGFYSVGDVTDERIDGPKIRPLTTVQLPLTPSLAPSFDALWQWNWGALAQTGMTWEQAAAVFPTWGDLLIGPLT